MPLTSASSVYAEIDRLIAEARTQCLWFLRADYVPTTDRARTRVLGQIERHGNLDLARRAAALRQWLSQRSSDKSAAC